MNKRNIILAGLFFFALAAPTIPSALQRASAPSADDIIRKSIDALGGSDKLRKVTSIVMRGSIKSAGMVGSIVSYTRMPNKLRVDVDFGALKISEGFDGKIAWQVNRGKVRQLKDAEAEFMRKEALDANNMVLRYRAHGIKTELIGDRKVNDKDAHIVGWKYPDGSLKKLFIDKQSFLVLGEERFRPSGNGKPTLELSVYSDFKPIDGLITPFRITMINQFGKSEILFREHAINSNVAATIFQMPAN